MPADRDRMEPNGSEHPSERTGIEEAKMGIPPRLLHGEVVSQRIPPAKQRKVDAPAPVCHVGNSDNQHTPRSEDTGDVGRGQVRIE